MLTRDFDGFRHVFDRKMTPSITGLILWIFLFLYRHDGVASAFLLRQTTVASVSSQPVIPKRLVLIGGGHAHLQVIKALNHKSRPKDLEVTLIDRQSSASYSGMVPGCVAGLYSSSDTLIQLIPLTDWAKIHFLQDEVVDVDLEQNYIVLRHHADPIPFDCVSFDIGSTTLGLDQIPGVREYAIPTRPISGLIRQIEDAEVELLRAKTEIDNDNNNNLPTDNDGRGDVKVVVVGGGPAGVELSMSFMGRWRPLLDHVSVTLLDAGSEIFPNESPACRSAVTETLANRGIKIIHNCEVKKISQDRIYLNDGHETLPFTHCIWATGAASHRLADETLRKRALAVNDRGWIQVSNTLQSLSHPCVFAAGDCSSIEGLPKGPPPKAGVYAVRAGPILIENLTNFLAGKPLTTYQPQDDFMKLMVCGDGTALGFRFGFPFYGKWVWELKDRIDRNFMALFQKENLPDLEDGAPFDTSQYDARREKRRPPVAALEAAKLLQRSDDNVDYIEAWDVLRDMAESEEYRQQVVECVEGLLLLSTQQLKRRLF